MKPLIEDTMHAVGLIVVYIVYIVDNYQPHYDYL